MLQEKRLPSWDRYAILCREHDGKLSAEEEMRLFVAVSLPSGLETVLQQIRRGIGHRLPTLRWVPPENLHLTLKFIGEVTEEKGDEIRRELKDCLADVPTFGLSMVGVGAFPSTTRPRIVWIGVREGHQALEALAERVERAMETLGYAREQRPFQAHFTIARARSPRPVKDLSIWKKYENIDAGKFRVDHVCLVQSQLNPAGSIYTVLQRYDLKDAGG